MRYLVWRRRGHHLARKLWADADEVVSASITYVETRAALAAGHRGRYWTASELGRLLQDWEAAWADVAVVDVDPLIAIAAELAQREPLSGCDAVQLAAAMASGSELLVSADRRLSEGARSQQLEVLDLNQVEG